MRKIAVLIVITVLLTGLTLAIWQVNDVALAESQQPDSEPMAMGDITAVTTDICTGTNLLSNPSFEGEYVPYVMPAPGNADCQTWNEDEPNQYCERVKLATDWHPFWQNTPRTEVWMNIQPEYVPSLPYELPPRVLSGEKSQHYFSFWSTHEAGMYQQITAVSGGEYCFSINGHAWSSRKTLGGFLSDPTDHGFVYQRVGVDPTGGTDWQSPNVIWSDERMQYDEFGLFSISAVAQSSQITFFAYSRAERPVKHNDVYWDDATATLKKMMTTNRSTILVLADRDLPTVVTETIGIDATSSVAWTAVLDSSGTLSPTLSQTSGDHTVTTLDVVIDTSGYSIGTYTTMLTLTADSETTNSPIKIPITLIVAEELYSVYLPFLHK